MPGPIERLSAGDSFGHYSVGFVAPGDSDLEVARAAYEAAIKAKPGKRITLRQG
jgi:hypothetical protein